MFHASASADLSCSTITVHDTQKLDAESGLDIQRSLASLPRSVTGAVGYGVVGRYQYVFHDLADFFERADIFFWAPF